MTAHLTQPAQVTQIIQINNPETLDETAQWLGRRLADANLTNSQIRNVFGTARQIEAKWRSSRIQRLGGSGQLTVSQNEARRDLILLKPKLHYQAARSEGRGNNPLSELKDWLVASIDAVISPSGNSDAGSEEERFKYFMEFFEAILAYHYEAEVAKEREKVQQRSKR